MEISLDNYLLCSENLALGRIGPSGMALNGESIVDPVQLFRALSIIYYDRGGESIEWSFRVTRLFSSLRLAQKFAATHRQQIPRKGRIKYTVGQTGDSEDLYLENAIVQPTFPQIIGVSVVVNYQVRGGIFSTDVPDDLPSADPEEDAVVFRRGKVSIANGATTVDVVFSSPLPAADYSISPTMSHSAGEDAIDCELIESSITVNGFSVKLSAPTTSANYRLHYQAFA